MENMNKMINSGREWDWMDSNIKNKQILRYDTRFNFWFWNWNGYWFDVLDYPKE